ncbi:hypothetical protein [Streptomyces sp. NPDC059080]|uniref:hypothetical protein n=1 Tax=Streptomyces sp. NPDC059080 TaxID=3346718 RepID=UPI0036C82169
MSDATPFIVMWATLALAIFAPWPRRAPGRHSAAHLKPAPPQPVVPPMPTRAPEILPPHVQARYRTIRGEDTGAVRPYVLARPRRRPTDAKSRAQADRRWQLDMALRGHDVGPTRIHGVHVAPGARTIRVMAA